MAGIATYRKQKPLSLVDALSNDTPKSSPQLPPQLQAAIVQTQQLAATFFGDTRQQHQASLSTTGEMTAERSNVEVQKQNLMIATSGLGLAIGGALLAPILYIPSALCCLYGFRMYFHESYRIFVEERRLDYRAVWTATIVVALAGGFVVTASFGSVLGLLNSYLVAKTENRSKQSIANLFGGQIHTVWCLIDGVEIETSLDALQRGDTVVTHAGQMIPVDGVIISGTATIDQHMLTGESQPVEKEAGDQVLASTVMLAGRICIEVDKAGDATVAAQITDILGQTNDFKRTLESRTDRFLNQITLPLLGISLLAMPVAGLSGAVAVLWYYPGARMMFFGPMSMLSYLQIAAQRGILIKDGRALEGLAEVDTVVFDKTGTLTLDQPTVSRVICCNGMTEQDLLRYAAAAEAKQSHPIARAIVQAATDQALELPLLEDAEYKVGYGLKTQIAGRTTRVGSVRFMTMEGIAVPASIMAQQAESHTQGHSMVLVALDDAVAGAIELQPTVRPEARAIIKRLHSRGIETVIISGDNDAPTRRLAADLGIDRYFAEVLPEDKAAMVTQLQEEGHKICFVGDGINDSIALKTADVAISLRGATTIATDMAEIVFMDGTLGKLPMLFELTDEFAANMRTNLIASTLPGIIGIAGTLLFGWGMTVCVLLSQGSSPIGIYNAIKPILDEQKQQKESPLLTP